MTATATILFIAIMTSAIAGGVALSHVLEMPGKHSLEPQHVAVIQQRLYPGFRKFGMFVEPLALLSVVVSMILLWGDGTAFWLAVIATAVYVLMGAVFPTTTEPMNRRIADWDPDDLPSNWSDTLQRWELSHALRAILMSTAAALLVIAVLVDAP